MEIHKELMNNKGKSRIQHWNFYLENKKKVFFLVKKQHKLIVCRLNLAILLIFMSSLILQKLPN